MNHCGKCTLPVYFAESVQAIGQHFHRHCFCCSNNDCGRSLDSRNCADHEGRPYCSHCHRYLFGPKGIGYGVGAGILSNGQGSQPFSVSYGQDRNSPVTSSISYGVVRQPPVTRHIEGTISATPVIVKPVEAQSIAQQFYAPTSNHEKQSSEMDTRPQKEVSPVRSSRPFRFQQKSLPCGKCEKLVYEAEKSIAAGRVWHKGTCFSCTECSKRLESRTICEREGLLYCNNCYARNYGPKGYGHGVGAGCLQLHQ